MDFENYYNNQIKTGVAGGFSGPRFQRGHGLGAMFKRAFRWIFPILKDAATPAIKGAVSSLSDEIGAGISNFSSDLKDKNINIAAAARERIKETIDKLKENMQEGSGKRIYTSRSGIKRRRGPKQKHAKSHLKNRPKKTKKRLSTKTTSRKTRKRTSRKTPKNFRSIFD